MTPKQWMLVRLVTLLIMLKLRKPTKVRQKICTSALSGKSYVQELLNGSSTTVYDLLRMEKNAFVQLCGYFLQKKWLGDSRYLNVEEKMAMFLMTISHNCRNRFIRLRFQHSGETVSRYFHEVLDAMMHFARDMIVPPAFDKPQGEIRSHIHLREGPFRGVVGALDGTLIDAHIPIDQQVPFRGRGQGNCFQNVLAVCDFDMKFIYVMAGWEGIAHDSRVLNETLRNPANKFPVPPPGMYYLCDAAYTHTRGFMAPYSRTRYWLRTFQATQATGRREKFNYAHAQLRNVIERTFGVLKKRFPILKKMPSYGFDTQRDIVIACMAVHNFLRRVSLQDELFRQFQDDVLENAPLVDSEPPPDPPSYSEVFSSQAQTFMVNLRDEIANELEND